MSAGVTFRPEASPKMRRLLSSATISPLPCHWSGALVASKGGATTSHSLPSTSSGLNPQWSSSTVAVRTRGVAEAHPADESPTRTTKIITTRARRLPGACVNAAMPAWNPTSDDLIKQVCPRFDSAMAYECHDKRLHRLPPQNAADQPAHRRQTRLVANCGLSSFCESVAVSGPSDSRSNATHDWVKRVRPRIVSTATPATEVHPGLDAQGLAANLNPPLNIETMESY